MPIYTKLNLPPQKPLEIDEYYKTPLAETLKASFMDAWESGPFASANRAMSGNRFAELPDMADQDVVDYARDWASGPVGMDVDAQAKAIADAGLEGKVKPDPVYDEETLQTVITARKAQEERQWQLDRAPAWQTPLALGAGMAASMLDPVEVASCFIPVVGQARKASMLAGAGGKLGRAVARAKIGAAEGLAGGLLSESLSASARQIAQQDHTAFQSLMNLAGGAVLGAALHPLAGLGAEFKRRKDFFRPWEMARPDDASRRLLANHARAIAEARKAASPGADAVQIEREALADAMLYDVFARSQAWQGKKTVQEIYDSFTLDYKSGNITARGSGDATGATWDFGNLQSRVENLGKEAAKPGAGAKMAGLERAQAEKQARALGGEIPQAPVLSKRLAQKTGQPRDAISIYEKQKAVIEFFRSGDAKSAPLALLNIIRKQLGERAAAAGATPRERGLWADVERLCGVENGNWDQAAVDRFNRKVIRQLSDPAVADPDFQPALNYMRGELTEICGEAMEMGVPASREAERFMAGIWRQSLEDSEREFQKALARLVTDEPENYLAARAAPEPNAGRAASPGMAPSEPSPSQPSPASASQPSPGQSGGAAAPANAAMPAPDNAARTLARGLAEKPAPGLANDLPMPESVTDADLKNLLDELARETDSLARNLEEARQRGLNDEVYKEMKDGLGQMNANLKHEFQEAELLEQYAACVLQG